MKKWIFIVIIIAMLGWAVFDLMNRKSADKFGEGNTNMVENSQDEENEITVNAAIGLEVGDKAPNFQLQTLTGDTVNLSDFRGNRVMINFWATWCPPCRAEIPDMEKFHQDKDVVILAVNLTDTETSITKVENFSNKYRLTFPILLDEDSTVSDLYAIQPIPTTYMVDSDGIIRYKAFGAMNYEWMVQEFEKMK